MREKVPTKPKNLPIGPFQSFFVRVIPTENSDSFAKERFRDLECKISELIRLLLKVHYFIFKPHTPNGPHSSVVYQVCSRFESRSSSTAVRLNNFSSSEKEFANLCYEKWHLLLEEK